MLISTGDDMEFYELPISPVHPDVDDHHALDEYVIHKHGIDGFFYFVQRTIDEWCDYVRTHPQRNEYSMRCLNDWYRDHYFLLDNFISIYGIVWDLEFWNFEWMSLIIDMENILKCTKDRVIDYGDLSLLIKSTTIFHTLT